MRRRVFVTGLGPVCSLGQDRRSVWTALLAGRCGVSVIPGLDGAPVRIGAAVGELRDDTALEPHERRLDAAACYALAAARRALDDAQAPGLGGERLAVAVGSSRGAAGSLERHHERFLERGAGAVSPHASPRTTPGSLAGCVSAHLGARGPSLFVSAACASATVAIGLAADAIRLGRADAALAGGTDACLTPFCLSMFASAGVLSRQAWPPASALRPFDRRREGTVIADGAAFILLESEEHMTARRAVPYCELAGFGACCDAASLTAPSPEGEGLARAVAAALRDARARPEEVGYVHAHATGTRAGDASEAAALRAALPGRPLVSSTKAATGHLLGASGGLSAAVCALALAEGVVPPTLNLEAWDRECELNHVTQAPRRARTGAALATASGFGGHHAALLFRRVS